MQHYVLSASLLSFYREGIKCCIMYRFYREGVYPMLRNVLPAEGVSMSMQYIAQIKIKT